MNKGRLEAFTDAILAIIMTIMVLELHTPEGFTLAAIQNELIPLLAYVISFVGITNLWATHHFIFEPMHKVSYGVFIVNMALLLWVSLVPITTA
ncbi:TMEM175 family protein [Secundilactobacillus paracollinoides]|nr:TMEM175 family protein [Secundilactobacillus paracollinoides]